MALVAPWVVCSDVTLHLINWCSCDAADPVEGDGRRDLLWALPALMWNHNHVSSFFYFKAVEQRVKERSCRILLYKNLGNLGSESRKLKKGGKKVQFKMKNRYVEKSVNKIKINLVIFSSYVYKCSRNQLPSLPSGDVLCKWTEALTWGQCGRDTLTWFQRHINKKQKKKEHPEAWRDLKPLETETCPSRDQGGNVCRPATETGERERFSAGGHVTSRRGKDSLTRLNQSGVSLTHTRTRKLHPITPLPHNYYEPQFYIENSQANKSPTYVPPHYLPTNHTPESHLQKPTNQSENSGVMGL